MPAPFSCPFKRAACALAASMLSLLLVACGTTETAEVEGDYPSSLRRERERIAGGTTLFSGDDGILNFFGEGDSDDDNAGSGIGVNAYLWQAALDTTSFMPTLQADPVGGTILKDWHSPDTANERFKVDVYIIGRRLSADAVRVQVFRQRRDGAGQWVDAPVAQQTSVQLEDAILARARELRGGA